MNGRIDLFEHTHYRGRRLSIYGTLDARINNYRNIWVPGKKGFHKRVSSVRFQLPKDSTYRLFTETGCPDDAKNPSPGNPRSTGWDSRFRWWCVEASYTSR